MMGFTGSFPPQFGVDGREEGIAIERLVDFGHDQAVYLGYGIGLDSVSYTHLTLPTIYSV